MPPQRAALPEVEIRTLAQWRQWLAANHERDQGIWLVSRRPGHGPRVAYEDIVVEALRYGWIDGQVRTLDEQRSAILVTPRRAGSTWSRPNKQRVAALRAAGAMTEAGEAVIARAVADGSWTFLDDVEDLVVPADLADALASADARDRFDGLTPGRRKFALAWIKSAKRPQTRAARIAATVTAAQQGRAPQD